MEQEYGDGIGKRRLVVGDRGLYKMRWEEEGGEPHSDLVLIFKIV